MSRVRFELINHEASMAALNALMSRAGVTLDPLTFIKVIALAFQEAQAKRGGVDMGVRFRADPCYPMFTAALRFAERRIPRRASALVLGCGAGYAGCDAGYATSVVREVMQPDSIRELQTAPVAAGSTIQTLSESYDLVVSHSLWHFIPNLREFGDVLSNLVGYRGVYVMGHEPNARFRTNEECARARRAARRSIAFRSSLEAFVRATLRRSSARELQASIEEEVNRILRSVHGFKADLSISEIRHIVDPHFPTDDVSGFRIGYEGFEWNELGSEFLTSFEILWTGTSGHLGVIDRTRVSGAHLRRETALSVKYPLDGSGFSAVWARR